MAVVKKQKSAIPNWKKKKFYDIIAPAVFSDKSVGESMCYSPEDLMNKVITVNLMNLTDNPRKQNFNIKLKVTKVSDNKGFTKPIVLTMSQSYIRRLIKPGRDRVDMSFTVLSKDGVLLRLKPLVIPKAKIKRSVNRGLLEKSVEFFTEYVGKNNFEVVFSEVTKGNTQKELKLILDKVFPTKLVEIRAVEVENIKGVRALSAETEEEVVEKTAEAPVEETSEEEVVAEKPKKPRAKKAKPKKEETEEEVEETSTEKETSDDEKAE